MYFIVLWISYVFPCFFNLLFTVDTHLPICQYSPDDRLDNHVLNGFPHSMCVHSVLLQEPPQRLQTPVVIEFEIEFDLPGCNECKLLVHKQPRNNIFLRNTATRTRALGMCSGSPRTLPRSGSVLNVTLHFSCCGDPTASCSWCKIDPCKLIND